MSESSQVVVATCRDSGEAALIRAVLTAHDIHVHISGENHAAMIGAGSSAVRQAVWVSRAHADEATALIEEMRQGGEAVLADDEIPADDAAERDEELTPDGALVGPIEASLSRGTDTVSRLSKRDRITLAVLAGAVLQHGTAHMSARAWKRGFVLLAAQVSSWWVSFGAHNVRLGVAMWFATVLMDMVGAIMHIVQADSTLPTAVVRRS